MEAELSDSCSFERKLLNEQRNDVNHDLKLDDSPLFLLMRQLPYQVTIVGQTTA